MADNNEPRPGSSYSGEQHSEGTGPAVSYPTAAPAADPQRVYENVPVPAPEKEARSGSKTGRVIYHILRVILYLAYLGWAALTCMKLWTELPGKGLLEHVTQYGAMLLAPALAIDILLRILRRIAYGKRAALMKRDRWALTGLILLLALVFVIWMVLWIHVVKPIAGI